MNKKSKRMLLVSVFLCLAFVLTACSPAEKKHQVEEMKFSLTKDFTEKAQDNTTWYYEGNDATVFAVKNRKEDLEKIGFEVENLEDYTAEIAKEHGILAGDRIEKHDTYNSFVYSRKVNKTNFCYLVCVYERKDCYWVVSYACYEESFPILKAQFYTWADGITFTEDE